ncbi:helix-turn-helix domain-containing protein, partial [Paenibacillus sp. TAF58]
MSDPQYGERLRFVNDDEVNFFERNPVAGEILTRDRPLRADAQRNYDNIVRIACEAFTENGVHASLDDIAKRAGVGAGTLYRHFPSRDCLLA